MADGTDRAAAGGGTKTSFARSLVDRVSLGYDAFRNGGRTDFFFPVQAQQPVAPQTQGRAWDYQTGYNLNAAPRREGNEGLDFKSIRAFADNYDLLRLVIETRKDQLCKMKWNIVGREGIDKKVKNIDPRVLELEAFFRRPDGTNTWNDWLRILVEDMLVIDAATIYPRKTLGGSAHSMEIIDGATIKLLINDDGRTPLPPDAAYQQNIKGMAASNYTVDELIYRPRNKRSWKMYGYSPVEQVLMTVNIALRRQVSQLQYYTEGNIPEAFASVPEEWTPDQIREMQTIWDSMIEGQQASKRKMKFIPGGVEVKQTREATIKDMFDEWLARIICFAFSISPQALIQMMNRATAETAQEQAMQEGLAPLQTWVKDIIDYIIEHHFGHADLVFQWADERELDPKTQSEVHKNYIEAGVLDIDEVREQLGLDPRNAKPAPIAGTPSVPSDETALPSEGSATDQPATGVAGSQTAAAEGVPAPIVGGDGAPLPTTAGGDADVQGTAMNGTQVSSLLEIVAQVAAKDLPKETAKALIMAAYPAVKDVTIDAMLDPLDNFEAPKPAPIVDAQGNPVVPPGGNAPAPGGEEGVAAVPGSKGKGSDDAEEGADDAEKMAKGFAKGGPGAHEHPDVVAHNHAHDHDEPLYKASPVASARKQLAEQLSATLAKAARDVAEQITNARPEPVEQDVEKLSKAARPKADRLIAKVSLKGFGDASEQLTASITIGSQTSAAKAAKGLKAYVDDMGKLLKLANTRAEAWAKGRAAELIGKNASGGELGEATRDMLRTVVVQAEEQGWSNARLSDELQSNYAFSRERASTIARTEMKTADSEGAMAGWKASGLKMKKEWVRSADDFDCEICEANEAQGAIDLDETFDSGDDTSPAHPNCNCAVLPVIDEENL